MQMMYWKALYHERDRQRPRPINDSSPHRPCTWYDGSVAEWTELVETTKPFVKTLGVKYVRASQTSYLRISIELIKTDSTAEWC